MSIFSSALAKSMYLSVVRHGITALGTLLVSDGLINSSQTNDLAGSILFLAGIAWSFWEKTSASAGARAPQPAPPPNPQ